MKRDSSLCRAAAVLCVLASVLAGGAPYVSAGLSADAGAESSAEAGPGRPGLCLSREEAAELAAREEMSGELAGVASGNGLAIVGLAAVIYLIWYYLDKR